MSYRLENGDGELLDSSQGQLPLVYMHNTNAILSTLERELTGKAKGDALDVVIYPEDGYGYAKQELVQEVPREHFAGIELSEGLRVKASNKQNDETEMLTITEVKEDTVVVDANHPLAGQILHFKIVIVDVREPTKAEIEQGFATSTNPT
ncbi:UNVERIFIED_CONTAM: hypothetical protein GTU68_014506 [Idotea baltica]|nr:hypothetical protein [Idotea baltica]